MKWLPFFAGVFIGSIIVHYVDDANFANKVNAQASATAARASAAVHDRTKPN